MRFDELIKLIEGRIIEYTDDSQIKCEIYGISCCRSKESWRKTIHSIINTKKQMEENGDKFNKVEYVQKSGRLMTSFFDCDNNIIFLQLGAYNRFNESRLNLLNKIQSNGHVLLSYYSGNKNSIDVDFKCGHGIQSVSVDNYKSGCRCPICSNNKIVKGVNDLATTHPQFIKHLHDVNDGYKYPSGSSKIIKIKCDVCNYVKSGSITNLIRFGFSCPKCSESTSYSERLMGNVLSSLKEVSYMTQLSATTFKWCDKYRYDFYIPSLNMIIETHGIQHYENSSRGRSLEEEQNNDRLKRELALSNGIKHYIELDCRYSILEWVKNSVLNSELSTLMNLSEVNWVECDKLSLPNRIKEACEIKKNNTDITTTDISRIFGINRSTAKEWLIKGNCFGWCHYNPKEEKSKSSYRIGKKNKKIRFNS